MGENLKTPGQNKNARAKIKRDQSPSIKQIKKPTERIEHNSHHNEKKKQNRAQELAQNLPQSPCDIFES
jgi:hypothetical protein